MKEEIMEIVGFHAHIYFDTESRDVAARIREGLTTMWPIAPYILCGWEKN